MALGNKIWVSGEGRYLEGIASGTLTPGTVVQLVGGTAPVNNVHTYQAWDQASDAFPTEIVVVLDDPKQGKTADDTYATGERVPLFIPYPGACLNMLIADVAGTGATSDYSVGDYFQVQDTTGLLEDLAVGTAWNYSAPFVCLENYSDMSGNTRLHCRRTGF